MWINIIYGLQLCEQAVPTNLRTYSHRAQTDGFGDSARFAHSGHFGLRCFTLRDADFDIAA
jgi:hypothetical protein